MDATLIGSLVTPVVTAAGLEVDRIEVMPAGKRKVVRIFLDGDGESGRGPSLDDIAEATKAISRVLDEARQLGNQPYTLEVSSRGVSRPLTASRHYRRNRGRLVLCTLTDGTALTGRITAADDHTVTLEIDGVTQEVPLAEVVKGVVQVELNRLPDDDQDLADEEGQ